MPSPLQSLHPLPWQPGEPPPPQPQARAEPMLLLVGCHSPLTPAGREVLLANLSPEEHRRHGAYRRAADRDRFLVARSSLRQLLGHWLALPPAAISIDTRPNGKPRSPTPGAPAFNLSHSSDQILLGFHPTLEVGVDLELVRPDLDWLPIARRVLAPAELTALQALPAMEQASAFFAAWCQLEARLKAQGLGLAGLEHLRQRDSSFDSAHATPLWDVRVPHGYFAAAALLPPEHEEGAGAVGG